MAESVPSSAVSHIRDVWVAWMKGNAAHATAEPARPTLSLQPRAHADRPGQHLAGKQGNVLRKSYMFFQQHAATPDKCAEGDFKWMRVVQFLHASA